MLRRGRELHLRVKWVVFAALAFLVLLLNGCEEVTGPDCRLLVGEPNPITKVQPVTTVCWN